MKKLLMASASLAFVFPGTAIAKPPARAHVKQYRSLYHRVQQHFGHRAPGCNLVKGYCGHYTDAELVRSMGVLQRMLAPPPPPPALATSSTSQTATATAPVSSTGSCGGITPYSGGGQCWAIPYSIVSCESGGQNVPNATGSPATGYYQIEGGGGSGSKASQDAAAHAMWVQSGSAPWSASQSCWG